MSKLNHVLNFMSNVLKNLKIEDEHFSQGIEFISDQLKLRILSKERYRYCTITMAFCSILYTISPHAYRYLRNHGPIILPHPETIKGVCNGFLTDPHIDEKKTFLTYAQKIFKYLKDQDKYVSLFMDEIHIDPYLDYKGGNVVGAAINNNDSLATSAYTFMITSICSNFKEVVHIAPVSKINHQLLCSFLKTIITRLESIGYKVFCVLSDNNSINGKAMTNFSPNKKLSIVYPHPVNPERPLFYLFDSVHLLKCIFTNWLNSKPNQDIHLS